MLAFAQTVRVGCFISQYANTLLISAAFVLSAFGWGAMFARRAFDSDFLEYVTVRFTLGCGVIYALCVALSLTGWMTRMSELIRNRFG